MDRRQHEVVLVQRAAARPGRRWTTAGRASAPPGTVPATAARRRAARALEVARRASACVVAAADAGSRNARIRSSCAPPVQARRQRSRTSAARSRSDAIVARRRDRRRRIGEQARAASGGSGPAPRDAERVDISVAPWPARRRRAAAARGTSDFVVRVLQDPQQGQRVLDVRGLEELQPAVLHERDVAAGSSTSSTSRVVRRPEQHRLIAAARRPRSRCRSTLVHTDVGLLGLVRHRFAAPAGARRSGRTTSVFSCRCGRERDRGVRRGQDRRGRAVVLLEPDHGRAGEPLRELQDVADGRGAEPVDRLRVVARPR